MECNEDFFVTEEEISRTPSNADGISCEHETLLRSAACQLIQEAGILLRLPQVTMCTAQILLQRFFFRKSLKKYDATLIAMSALFLSSKLEEEPRRSRSLISVFHHLRSRILSSSSSSSPQSLFSSHSHHLDVGTTAYFQMKDDLFRFERSLLIQMGFRVHCTHPYKYMLPYAKIIQQEGNKKVLQFAVNCINDSYRTPVHVTHTGRAIAVAALFMAIREEGVALPEEKGEEWWRLFDVEIGEIYEICTQISRLYSLPKFLPWVSFSYKRLPNNKMDLVIVDMDPNQPTPCSLPSAFSTALIDPSLSSSLSSSLSTSLSSSFSSSFSSSLSSSLSASLSSSSSCLPASLYTSTTFQSFSYNEVDSDTSSRSSTPSSQKRERSEEPKERDGERKEREGRERENGERRREGERWREVDKRRDDDDSRERQGEEERERSRDRVGDSFGRSNGDVRERERERESRERGSGSERESERERGRERGRSKRWDRERERESECVRDRDRERDRERSRKWDSGSDRREPSRDSYSREDSYRSAGGEREMERQRSSNTRREGEAERERQSGNGRSMSRRDEEGERAREHERERREEGRTERASKSMVSVEKDFIRETSPKSRVIVEKRTVSANEVLANGASSISPSQSSPAFAMEGSRKRLRDEENSSLPPQKKAELIAIPQSQFGVKTLRK